MTSLRPQWHARSKPLLTVLATFIAYVALVSVLLVGTILVLALLPGVNVALGVAVGDPTSPLDATLALAMGAMWLPAALIGVRFGGWRPVGTLLSVAARWRREVLTSTGVWAGIGGLLVVAVAAGAGALASASAPGASPAPEELGSGSVGALVGVCVVVLLLAPMQVAGLEMTMRGVILQVVGTWVRAPWLPILVAAAVPMFGRFSSPSVLIATIGVAAAAAVLTWKSGGLELPFALMLTVTIGSLLASAFAAGTGAGAGVRALSGGVAAPGTSATVIGGESAASLAGGIGGAAALLVLTVVLMIVVSRREGLGFLEPVRRSAAAPAPELVPF